MGKQEVKLSDRLDLTKSSVLLNGTQALVRLMLMQKARDRAAGLNTAGYVSGYRGSPLGGVDLNMMKSQKLLEENDIIFHPGLNEDLAATAIWGTQQTELHGQGKYDGVFALWYGKGPGVDRTGDVMRHANLAGSSRHGGVIMAMGDDHTGESSLTLHQSDWAMVDVYMPVVSPAGVQEILDYGLYSWALSRFAGVWVGLKIIKDTAEATAVIDGSPDRMQFVTPDFAMPKGGLNIQMGDTPVSQEVRMIDYKRNAAEAFSRANKMDKRVWGKPGAKIGLVAAGKNWLDLQHAFQLLGIDEAEADRLGITTYKVGQTWPLDMRSFHDWAEDLDLIVVVEEKRKLIEVQIKEAIFDDRQGRRVYGWRKGQYGEELFPTKYALDPVMVAEKLGGILIDEGRGTDEMKARLSEVIDSRRADNAPELASRTPYFCSGCPHNTSTKVPEGSVAYSGIGCHFLATAMERNTMWPTQMGGEGVNWVGQAPFSKRQHVFQNLGDGTYNHSGILAIRAALAAKTTMTYKILFNDAVAMTGGQPNEGDLQADQIVREVLAMGVKNVALVYDAKEEIDFSLFPKGIEVLERAGLMPLQERYAKLQGVSVIVYVQTCAAEKRRRRKRGKFPDPDRRVFINTDICEGCGDCGVQSNCVSIVPVETELGRKRGIDQSSCNKDFSCLDGLCPSFVTLEGATVKKSASAELVLPEMPAPALPKITGTHNIVITGVGGTGVVTIGAVLAMAAHIDGKGAGLMEMAGLAQKGGAVHIHLRLAEKPADITAIRVAVGEADAIIGGDLVVTAGARTFGLMRAGRTGAVVNSHEIITGAFTRDRNFTLPTGQMRVALEARLKQRVTFFDASDLARRLLGDSIYSNMMMMGAAWQQGLVPLAHEAIHDAIRLNGVSVEANQRAFEIGRWAMLFPEDVAKLTTETAVKPLSLDEKTAFRADHLSRYQNAALAARYRALVASAPEALRGALAEGYHKLLAYKDEYEVARLHLETARKAREEFGGDFRMTFHLAPPLLSGKTAAGRPKKRAFGPWMRHGFRLLAALKALRGTALDPFGYGAERRTERRLIAEYEADMAEIIRDFTPERASVARDLAALPLEIRGFGLVKDASVVAAEKRRAALLAAFRAGSTPVAEAAE